MSTPKPIVIKQQRTFISFKHCRGFDDMEDVRVELPVLPVPGNLFSAEYFLPDDKQKMFNSLNDRFFVQDVHHEFIHATQLVIISLLLAPRNPVKSTRN